MGIFSFLKNEEKEAEEKAFRLKTEEMLTKLTEEMKKGQELTEKLSQDIRQVSSDVRRHDMALEDCLDALEEQQEEQRKSRDQIRKLEAEQEKLLKLLAVYQEQLWGMKRYAGQNAPEWISQLELMEKAAEGARLSSGIAWIEESGVQVDYALHEVIEARTTSEEAMDMRVAEIYSPGVIWRGEVKKKARVAAYRLEREGQKSVL